jgi:ubiquinone/menaquinone biosynthesis C-methylase UbiE/uncharacterized membrane protein YbhN (UPF0104 family)
MPESPAIAWARERFRRPSRPTRLLLWCLAATAAVGGIATLYAMVRAHAWGSVPSAVALAATALVGASTVANLFLRFVRWHYLLRRLNLRLQTIPSLGAYVGSFAFLAVPLYLGQLIARRRLASGVPAHRRGDVVLVFLWERLLDVAALTLLALPAFGAPVAVVSGALLLAAFVPAVQRRLVRHAVAAANYACDLVGDEHHVDAAAVIPVLVGQRFVIASLLSVVVWMLTAAAFVPLAHACGLEIAAAEGTAAAARSILLGALSLSPLGAGVAGFVLFGSLEQHVGSFPQPSAATQAIFLYRVATAWLSVGLGGVAFLLHRSVARRPTHADHFDDIDECYDTWIPEHIRDHVVRKKVDVMREHLDRCTPPLRGLDIGCGRGWYLRELLAAHTTLLGLDTSIRQIAAAREYVPPGVPLVQGTVLALPFAEASFDFAYIINVLHHMPSKAHQGHALAEMARTLRPGGLLFLHEFNVTNPLFRFYLSYVFPILKGIEEGTEPYMDPQALARVPGLEMVSIECFSFTPDFVPAALLPPARAIERWLERTPLVRYSAHFMAVFRRTEE